MRQIKNDFADVLDLHRNEKIPKELITNKYGATIIKIDDQLLQLKNNPVFSALLPLETEDKDEFIEKTFGELKYKEDEPKLLRQNFADFKLPKELFRYVMKYFRDLYTEHKSEAAVLLMLNPEKKDWQILPVLQTGSYSSVEYFPPLRKDTDLSKSDKEDAYKDIFENKEYWKLMKYSLKVYEDLKDKGYEIYGTIHSHCDFSAFHSGIDDDDEMGFDGLHLTIGNVDTDFSFSGRWMVGQNPIEQKLTQMIDIKNEKELTKDIDSVKIDPDHMKMFVKDLEVDKGRSYGFRMGSYGRYGNMQKIRTDMDIESKFYDPDHMDLRRRFVCGEGFHGPSSSYIDMEEKNRKYENTDEHIIFEEAGQRLYDIIEKKAFWVSLGYFSTHRELFPDDRYLRLEDPELPDDEIEEAEEHFERTSGGRMKKEYSGE